MGTRVPGQQNIIFNNGFGQIEYILNTLGPLGAKFKLECYDVAHLYNLKHFLCTQL